MFLTNNNILKKPKGYDLIMEICKDYGLIKDRIEVFKRMGYSVVVRHSEKGRTGDIKETDLRYEIQISYPDNLTFKTYAVVINKRK